MAAVLLSLGYFLIWPVILLLINSFNTAADWFVEPRSWGLRHWQNAFQRPGFASVAGQLSSHLVSDGGHQFSDRGCHCLDPGANQDSLQPHVGIHVLDFLHGARASHHHRMDYLVGSGHRMDQCWPDKARIIPAGSFQHLQCPGHRLCEPDGSRHFDQGHAADAGLSQHGCEFGGGRAGRRRQQPAHSVQGHLAPDDFTDDSGLCAATPARLPVL